MSSMGSTGDGADQAGPGTPPPGRPAIRHEPAAAGAGRFSTMVDGCLCVLDYQRHGGVVAITHTGVPPAVGGRGIAAALVAAALQWVADEGLKVDPQCSYVRVYMQRHRQTLGLLAGA